VCSGIAGTIAILLSRRDVVVEPDEAHDVPSTSPTVADVLPTAEARTFPAALPLAVAFASGVTSLGFQVTWTRLLASGSGGYTYVFTVILAIFLIGLALGATIFNIIRPRLTDPVRALVACQIAVAVIAMAGLVLVLSRPEPGDPGNPIASVRSLMGMALIVVLPATTVMGIVLPLTSSLLRGRTGESGTESGGLLAVNTTGAIIGSVVFPFVLMPLIGSPLIIVLLAAINVVIALALALVTRPSRPRLAIAGVVAMVAILVVTAIPGAVAQPNESVVAARGGTLFRSTEDEIASVQAGQITRTPEL
jgi:spermidine synthase